MRSVVLGMKLVNHPEDDPLDAMANVYVTVDEILRMYHLNSANYVRKLASIWQWPKQPAPASVRYRHGAGRSVAYCLADVDRVLGKTSQWDRRDLQ